MPKCKQCQSTKIKSRTNHTHGAKSKGRTTFTCKACGSNEVEAIQKSYGRRGR